MGAFAGLAVVVTPTRAEVDASPLVDRKSGGFRCAIMPPLPHRSPILASLCFLSSQRELRTKPKEAVAGQLDAGFLSVTGATCA
jgi:hypothetical protein